MARKRIRKTATKSVAKKIYTRGVSLGLAIICLLLNVLILPGFGTLIAGKSKSGAWQIALSIIGIIFASAAYIYETPFLYIGSPLWIAAWIWGLVTGVKLIQEAR